MWWSVRSEGLATADLGDSCGLYLRTSGLWYQMLIQEYAGILGCYHLVATFLDHSHVGIEKGSVQKDVRSYRTWESTQCLPWYDPIGWEHDTKWRGLCGFTDSNSGWCTYKHLNCELQWRLKREMRLVQHRSEPLEHNLELLVVGNITKNSKTLAICATGLGMLWTWLQWNEPPLVWNSSFRTSFPQPLTHGRAK